MSWTSEQATALAERILSFSKADECEVSLRLSEAGHTRFAANDITTAGHGPDRHDRRSPAARRARAARRPIDEIDDDRCATAVARSEALMASAQPDPEQVEGLGPQDYPDDPRLRRVDRDGRPAPSAATASRRRSIRAEGEGSTRRAFSRTAPAGRPSPTRRVTSASTGRPSPTTRRRCGPPTAPARATPRSAPRDRRHRRRPSSPSGPRPRPRSRPSRAICRPANTP